MVYAILALPWLVSLQAASQPPSEEAPARGFLYRTVVMNGKSYGYSAYVPPDYTPERAWPVVLFLHGSGERGSDGFLQTDVGIAHAIRKNYELCPAIVVMPQCAAGRSWNGDMLDMALQCVQDTSAAYHCDPKRLYLTGLSLGGAGAWLLGSQTSNTFAAVAPICGFLGDYRQPADPVALKQAAVRLAKVPIWCFHGAADPAVPVERSREIVAAVKAAGGDIQYTEFPNAGHNVWDLAYQNPALWRWLLAQKRPSEVEQTTPPTP
jgi:predicted peptidase